MKFEKILNWYMLWIGDFVSAFFFISYYYNSHDNLFIFGFWFSVIYLCVIWFLGIIQVLLWKFVLLIYKSDFYYSNPEPLNKLIKGMQDLMSKRSSTSFQLILSYIGDCVVVLSISLYNNWLAVLLLLFMVFLKVSERQNRKNVLNLPSI